MPRLTMKRRAMWLAVALALLGTSVASAETAQEIAGTALRSTVLLTVEDDNGQPLRSGIGFLVGDGLIASSLHVVEGASAGYVSLAGEEIKYALGNVTAKDRERDLVVIEIPATGLPTLPVGNSDTVQAGDRVYVAGNLRRPDGAFLEGIVSGIREIESGTVLQIAAPTPPVSSGGPVLNAAGEVIGITVASVRDGQNLIFAIPANPLAKLLEGPLPAEPLSTSEDDAGAFLSLGLMYYYGTGVPQSYAEAARWLQRAADQEQAEAQSMLGTMYYFGEGVPQNHLEASRLFRRAAEQGHPDARRWLGTLYHNGTGVPQNYAEAARWLRYAADQGDAEAQSKLGIMHYFGEGVPQNHLEASRLFRRAAEQGHPDARRWLGTLYHNGTGVPQNYAEAARWLRYAADQGDAEAQSNTWKPPACSGVRPNKATQTLGGGSEPCTTTAQACRRVTCKRHGGTASPPARGTWKLSGSSEACSVPASACSRITRRQPGGTGKRPSGDTAALSGRSAWRIATATESEQAGSWPMHG
jgi:TPR repeat protein